MKNFRKVLALVLVVATLFSFTAMAGAKSLSDYEDADKVSYKPAVDILSTLGILNGYEDDTFKPTATITREEMAKMIAVLANSGSDVSTLYASACTFADVATSRWSASYVAYCAKTGIVAGRSASTFDPTGKVTGLETAKMLLVTMGFTAEKQGYVGADWKVNVLRDAKNCGLLNGFATGYDVDVAITREEAAQMMLNALNAKIIIGYVSENVVTITNTAYKKWDGTLIDATNLAAKNWTAYGNAIVAESTLAQALFGTSFGKTNTNDCFGRPGYYWSYTNSKGEQVSDAIFFAEPLTYTSYKGVDFSKVLEKEVDNAKQIYSMDVYRNGQKLGISCTKYNAADEAELTKLEPTIGKGTLVEVYVDDSDRHITVVIVDTFIGIIDYTTNKAGKFYVNHDGTTLSKSNKTYGFKEDDVVLYWVCNGNEKRYTATIHDAKLAESVVGLVGRATTDNGDPQKSTVSVAGTVYEYAKNFGNYAVNWDIPVGTAEVNASTNLGTQYVLYLDEYGYVMGWKEYTPKAEYVYAYAVEGTGEYLDKGENGKGAKLYEATRDMVYFDESYVEDVAVDQATWDTTKERYTAYNRGFGSLIRYELDSADRASGVRATLATAGSTLAKNGTITDGAKTIYSNKNTLYMIRTWNYDAKAFDYEVYGYGELEGTYYTKEDKTGYTNIQYFTDAANSNANVTYASYVFVDAAYIGVAQRAYVVDYIESVTDGKFYNQIGAYDSYEAVINGEKAVLAVTKGDTVLKVAADAAAAAKTAICNLYTVSLKCIGLDDAGVPVYANVGTVATNSSDTLKVKAGVLEYKKDGVWTSAAIDADAFAVVAFTGGYSFDGGKTKVDYKICETFDGINGFYETVEAVTKAGDEAFTSKWGWVIDADKDGDIDEVYFTVE